MERVEPLPARDLVRLRLTPVQILSVPETRGPARPLPVLPPQIRVNLAVADVPVGLAPGTILKLSARLMPPPEPAVPGAYNYARTAWFDGIGATGRGFAPVSIVTGGGANDAGLAGVRVRLVAAHSGERGRRRGGGHCGGARDRRSGQHPDGG